MQNETTSDVVVGAMMTVFGLIGLVMATHARDVEILIFGSSLAVFAVAFVAGIVRRRSAEAKAVPVKGQRHG